MHPDARFLFTASMDVDPEKEALFHEVYDAEHIPMLLQVPGVLSAVRCESVPLRLAIGGEVSDVTVEGEPRFHAIYELASAEVLQSPEWAQAVERGRWPGEVRPHTRNRRHTLRRLVRPDDR
ncbi:MAG: hypothetical protein GC151_14665 [Betaproteobacteria bacterium]|nr:hypothetical protein [Betaproteobacteria bacterium]